MREIDLGLDLIGFPACRARASAGRRFCRFEMGPDLLGLEVFERTGMRLLFSDAHFRQHVENRFAFNFQLPCQIVDSNLTHPPFPCSALAP
jgi:hypothetical protein